MNLVKRILIVIIAILNLGAVSTAKSTQCTSKNSVVYSAYMSLDSGRSEFKNGDIFFSKQDNTVFKAVFIDRKFDLKLYKCHKNKFKLIMLTTDKYGDIEKSVLFENAIIDKKGLIGIDPRHNFSNSNWKFVARIGKDNYGKKALYLYVKYFNNSKYMNAMINYAYKGQL